MTSRSNCFEARIWSEVRTQAERTRPIPVLLVSPRVEDHRALERILARPGFRFASVSSTLEAVEYLHRADVAVLIAECRAPGCCWKDVLRAINSPDSTARPRLIVAAQAEDDSLWDEIADLGADSVVTRPFQRDEIISSVSDAWILWSRQSQLGVGRTRRKLAQGAA